MRVTRNMIDPELRLAGLLGKAFFRPSVGFFRFLHHMTRRSAGQSISGLDCDERLIASMDGSPDVRVRIYRPLRRTDSEMLPGVLFLHGGGYALGSPEMSGSTYELLMQTRACVIVAPDYRKSFDAPYPAALNDCYATLLWMKENASELGLREDQLIVIGQSAGGGLTAALALMARDRGEVRIAFQMPLYPMIDDRNSTDSAHENDAPIWNARHNRLGWDLYLGELAGSDHIPKYAAPARETDYSDLPPTATFVGDLDPFRDETLQYVEQLRTAGVAVEFRLYAGCFHGFDMISQRARVSREANAFMAEQFAAAVDECFAKQP
jgi:acetyl esterase/lipase